jgi:nucleotide-binding universal stress UspA family protein
VDRYLIVANQTLGGSALDHELRARLDRGPCTFHIVIPMIAPELETVAWGAAEIGFVVPMPDADAVDQARRRSEHRLEAITGRIEALGGTVTGEVGDTDPVEAVRGVLSRERFDEVIVSTLPAGLSRWLRMDLPSRLGRLTDVPLTVVEAESRA